MRINLKVAVVGVFLAALAALCVSCNEDGRRAHSTVSRYGSAPIAGPNVPPRRISPSDALQRLSGRDRVYLVDVRTELERAAGGSIQGDFNVPLDPEATFLDRIRRYIPDRDAPVILYCQNGVMTDRAGALMSGMGYRDVFLLGGIDDWPYEKL